MVPTRQLSAVSGRRAVAYPRAAHRATRIHAANASQRPHRAGVIVRFKPDTQQSKDSVEQPAPDVAPGTTPSTQPPAVPEPEAPTAVPVVFSLQKRCEFGDAYAIVGATPELGGWDTSAALALQWHEGDVWEASAPLPVATAVSFKYIRTHNGECVEWSSGSDFQVTVSSKGSASPGLMTEAYAVQLEGGSEDSGLKVALATDAQAAATTAAALSELETNAAALSAMSSQQQQEQQQEGQQGRAIKASDLPQGNVNGQSTEQGGGAFEQKEGVSEALQEALEPQLIDTGADASPVKGSSAIITEDEQQEGQQGQAIKASDLPQGNVNEQSTGQGGGAFEQKEGVSEALQEALEPQLVDTGADASPVKGSSAIITDDAQQQHGQQQGQTIKASDLPQGNVNEQSAGQGGGAFEQKEGVSEALQEALEPQLVDTGADASPVKGSSAIITEDAQQQQGQQQGQTIKASDLPQGNVNEQSSGQGGGAFEQKEGVSEALQEALEPQLVDTGPDASPVKGSSAIITEDAQQQAPAAEHTDASATGGTPASNSLVTDAIPAPAGTKWAEGGSATDTPTATDTSPPDTATAKQVATPATAPPSPPSDTDGKAGTDRVAAAGMGKEPPKAAQDAAAAVLPELLKGGGALKDAAGQLLSATPQEREPEAGATPAEVAKAVSGGADKGGSAAKAANAMAGGPELADAQDRQGALAPAKDAVSEDAKEAMVQEPAKAQLGTNTAAPAETTTAEVDVGHGQPAWPAVEEGLDEDVAEEPQGEAATKSVEEAESKVAAAAKGQAIKAKRAAGPLSLLYLVGGWLLGK